MKDLLCKKLIEYLWENNPDILFSLQEEGRLLSYLEGKLVAVGELIENLIREQKPAYLIEGICLDTLTEDLRPSKFHYIKETLEEEFEDHYQKLLHSGLLTYETINLISICNPLFEAFSFSEENEDKHLRYTVIGAIKEYFEKRERETRVSWLTMPIIN